MDKVQVKSSFFDNTLDAEDKVKKFAPIFKTPASPAAQRPSRDAKIKTPKRKRTDSLNKDDSKKRDRTPSGQNLSGRVGDLRTFFHARDFNMFNSPAKDNEVTPASLNCPNEQIVRSVKGMEGASDKTAKSNQNKQTAEQVDCTYTDNQRQQTGDKPIIGEVLNMIHQNKQMEADNRMDINTQDEATDSAQPCPYPDPEELLKKGETVMDIRIAVSMFNNLRLEMQQTKNDVSTLITNYGAITPATTRLNDIEKAVQEHDQAINSNGILWQAQTKREEVLIGALSRLTKRYDESLRRIEKLESVNAKKMLSLSGFYADTGDRYTARQQLEGFFRSDLKVAVEIEDFYFVGAFTPPNIIITVQNQNQKREALAAVDNIKSYINRDNKRLFLREYYTTEANEARKKKAHIHKMNEQKEEDLRFEITFKGGSMQIDGHQCLNPVAPPDPLQVLSMPMEKLNEIMDYPLNTSPKLVKKDNIFIAASATVSSFEQINKAYMAMKLKHPGARHIVAVWNIPTDMIYDGQNYVEDEELGVGQSMLSVLVSNDITHRAVFVARYAAAKLNDDRIPAYVAAVEAIIQQAPYNTAVGIDQKIQEKSEEQQSRKQPRKQTAKTPRDVRKFSPISKSAINPPNYRGRRRTTGAGKQGMNKPYQKNNASPPRSSYADAVSNM